MVRTWSSVKEPSNSRIIGPTAQEALLSLALPSSSAERPSTSRRFTSLPSVAPTMRPVEATTTTTSGSGLFQVETGFSPASMPWPTADMICDLVKISASGPIPTSRYCDQAPFSISTFFSSIASAEPARSFERSLADQRADGGADFGCGSRVAARPLLDHAFQHGGGEGHARRLQRLQVHRAPAARAARRRAFRAACWP